MLGKTDDDAIFRGAAAGAGKVSLDKISWVMPHVISADAEKCFIYKTIESKFKLPVAYRTRKSYMLSVTESKSFTCRLSVKRASEKPRFSIIGLQADKDTDQTKTPSTCYHVNLKNANVMLNSDRYPAVDYNLSFPEQKLCRIYGDAAWFGVKSVYMNQLITQSKITPSDYKTLHHLFRFDFSKEK